LHATNTFLYCRCRSISRGSIGRLGSFDGGTGAARRAGVRLCPPEQCSGGDYAGGGVRAARGGQRADAPEHNLSRSRSSAAGCKARDKRSVSTFYFAELIFAGSSACLIAVVKGS